MQSSLITSAPSVSGRPLLPAAPQLRVLARPSAIQRRVITHQESQKTEAELEKVLQKAKNVGKLPVPMMEEAEQLKKKFVAIQEE